jgi:hypothetical protein
MMASDAVVVALIAAIPPTVVGAGALVLGIINRDKITSLHVLINSQLAQRLLDAVDRGRQQERDSSAHNKAGQ